MQESKSTRFIADVLRDLDEDGGTGLDMSPGNALSAEAAAIIRDLIKQRDATKPSESEYRLTDDDLNRIVNDAKPATELGWAVKDLLLAHYEMSGLRDEIESLKKQVEVLKTQRDVAGVRHMKNFSHIGHMEVSLDELLRRLDKGSAIFDRMASVLENDTDQMSQYLTDARALRSAAYLIRAGILEGRNIEQTCGKALGYPWFKDDQKNFPGATDADGVCVGEHVPETIASELAKKYIDLLDVASKYYSWNENEYHRNPDISDEMKAAIRNA